MTRSGAAAFVSRQVWARVNVQLLTGCRPYEVVRLRPLDFDMSGEVWAAAPS